MNTIKSKTFKLQTIYIYSHRAKRDWHIALSEDFYAALIDSYSHKRNQLTYTEFAGVWMGL